MSLNKAQQAAVDSTSSNILVLAGAGTGKTHTMISRISRLVDDGVDISNILVLTFTNAAAREMKERYSKLHPGNITPMFCTFHAFCYTLIARDYNVRCCLGYNSNTVPTIPDDASLRKLETMCKKQCGVKLSDDKLKGKVPLTKQEKFFYDIYWKHYNKLMRMQNYITFDIMCDGVCNLFCNCNPCVDTYKRRYTHIFVDEFQDTDPLQWKFVSSFEGANKFVVGDAKQAIYSFRGADSSIIKQIAQSNKWETIKLSQNYRSTKCICDFSNGIHTAWKGTAYNLDIESDKSGGNVTVKEEFEFEGNKALSQLFTMFDLSKSEDTYALLCRTNAEVAQVKALLQQANIPFRTNNHGKDVAGILKSAADSAYMVGWLSDKLSSNEYNNYIRLCACDPYYETEEGFMSEYGQRIARYTQDIFAVRAILDSDTFPQQKCIDIGKILHLPSAVIELEDQTNAAVVEYLLKEIESSKVETNIYVGTIHSVKGLEFDVVHLLGVNGKSFPLTKEEQLNLYYVGCTRAKRELTIWWSDYDRVEHRYSNYHNKGDGYSE